MPTLSEVLQIETPPGLLELLCSTVINLGAGCKPGIFREAANVDMVKDFESKLENGELECLLFCDKDAYNPDTLGGNVVGDVLVACDLLKIWFRRLPDPLVPYSLYDLCIRAGLRSEKSIAYVGI